jgi:signal transduction histidine kinase
MNQAANNSNLIEKFIYSCSHDLRAPVSSIQGLVRIAEYYPHHDETHKCLEMIEACTHTMDKLIKTMEEYLVNNHQSLNFTDVDVAEFLKNIGDGFKNQLDTCNIVLSTQVGSFSHWKTDLPSISKILKYLISNAIAFHDPTKEKKEILVSIYSLGSKTVLEVYDNGVGIPEAEAQRLFEIFHRGSENTLGIGMGLFLTKSIVEKMGGDITCTSVINEGTTITISLPGVTAVPSED